MPLFDQLPMSVTAFTIVAASALCMAGFAHSQGWFARMRPATKKVNNKAGNGRAIDKKASHYPPADQP